MSEKQQNLQDTFLNAVRKSKACRHHLPGQWRQAAGQHHLVRQFLRAAAPRRPGPAGLQARHLDRDADGPDPASGRSRARIRLTLASGQRRFRHPCRAQDRAAATCACAMREARLAEAVGLTAAIDLDVTRGRDRAAGAAGAGHTAGHRQGGGDRHPGQGAKSRKSSSSMPQLTPVQQRNLEKAWERQGAGPHRADPGNLRRARRRPGKGGCRSSWRI